MNPFVSLYFLLTSRIPVPKTGFLSCAMILLTYCATAPHNAALSSVGLNAITLSVAAGYIAAIFRNMRFIFESPPEGSSVETLIKTAIPLWVTVFALLLFAPSPFWIQHGISFGLAIYGMVFLLIERLDPTMLSQFNWIGRLSP